MITVQPNETYVIYGRGGSTHWGCVETTSTICGGRRRSIWRVYEAHDKILTCKRCIAKLGTLTPAIDLRVDPPFDVLPGILMEPEEVVAMVTHKHICPNCEATEVYPGSGCPTPQYRLCQHCPEQADCRRVACPWDTSDEEPPL